MSEAVRNHITPEAAVLARLMLWVQESDARARRALNAPEHQQREEIAAILGRLAQLLDVCAEKSPTALLLVRTAYALLAINKNQLDALFKPPKKPVALQFIAELRAHLALPIAVLRGDDDLPVAEAADAVARVLKAKNFLPRRGRGAGKPISASRLAQWFYAVDGGYADDETVTTYRMAQEQMRRAHPDHASWTRDQRHNWLQGYIVELIRNAVLF